MNDKVVLALLWLKSYNKLYMDILHAWPTHQSLNMYEEYDCNIYRTFQLLDYNNVLEPIIPRTRTPRNVAIFDLFWAKSSLSATSMLYVAIMTLQCSKVIFLRSWQVLGNSRGSAGDTGAVRKSSGYKADPFMDWTRRFSTRFIASAMGANAAANAGANAAANAGANHGGGASTLLKFWITCSVEFININIKCLLTPLLDSYLILINHSSWCLISCNRLGTYPSPFN